MKKLPKVSILLSFLFAPYALANTSLVLHQVASEDQGKSIGTVTAADTPYGLLLTPNLFNLTPGLHGFHLHVKSDCSDNGMAAGGHLDPQKTDKHLGPYNNQGHLGDMPPLYVAANGRATLPVLAPRLKETDLKNHALMVHAGGDNYSDNPPMGGGGARIACGVTK